MTPTIEQIKEILAGADKEQYYRFCEIKEWSEDNQYHSPTPAQVTSQNGFEPYIEKHNLSDLRTILAQHEEIERMKAAQSEVAARAVEEILNWDHSYIQTEEGRFAYYDYAIESYANQLREQGDE